MMTGSVDFESTRANSGGSVGMQRLKLQNSSGSERGPMAVAQSGESARRGASEAALAQMSLEELLYYVLVGDGGIPNLRERV
jgi:hypothetical protein